MPYRRGSFSTIRGGEMSEGKQDNWELIAKSLLLLIVLALVALVAFWRGMQYVGPDVPFPQPHPQPFPVPQPEYEVWYRAPYSVTKCLPVKFCDGIPRPGWLWQINRLGIIRYAPPPWGGDVGAEPPEGMIEALKRGIGQEPPDEITPIPDPISTEAK